MATPPPHRRDQMIDDSRLTPQMAARIWRVIPEDLRHRFMNTIPEPLADQVLELTSKPGRDRCGQ